LRSITTGPSGLNLNLRRWMTHGLLEGDSPIIRSSGAAGGAERSISGRADDGELFRGYGTGEELKHFRCVEDRVTSVRQRWGSAVPMTPFLRGREFDAETTRVISVAFHNVCRSLRLKAIPDPATEVVANKLIELAQRGERDPERLTREVLKAFRLDG
jgi:hypothetical protein